MGRFEKTVLDEIGIDRRELGYYSTPPFIADFLGLELLRISPSASRVLDPAVGQEELLQPFLSRGLECDAMDIISHKSDYQSHFNVQDFISYFSAVRESRSFLPHDIFVANPPYNCHEVDYIRTRKKELQALFPEVGVHNMYSMFMAAMIDIAKPGALIGLIVSDSFMSAKAHSGLRKKIITDCAVHTIMLLPTDLFRSQGADVRTCLLVLQKGTKYQGTITLLNRPSDRHVLKAMLAKRDFDYCALSDIVLDELDEQPFGIGIPCDVRKLLKLPKLGGRFPCITGISTGNDKKYLSQKQREGFSVPFFKNPGTRSFTARPDAYLIDNFLEEEKRVKSFMVRNKPLLFSPGIVCSSMGLFFSASYLPRGSVFGVNPGIFPPEEDIPWLVAYLNSSLVTYLIRSVLIRSNMVTSGYVSQLPLLAFTRAEKSALAEVSESHLHLDNQGTAASLSAIDQIVFTASRLSPETRTVISEFVKNLQRTV